MSDLISREDVLNVAYKYCPDDDGSCSNADKDLRELLDDIEDLPSVNQKTGHWIEQGLSPYEGIRRCSVCYKTYDIRAKFNYCPNCGAKMEGE